jgi:hypothetical protein
MIAMRRLTKKVDLEKNKSRNMKLLNVSLVQLDFTREKNGEGEREIASEFLTTSYNRETRPLEGREDSPSPLCAIPIHEPKLSPIARTSFKQVADLEMCEYFLENNRVRIPLLKSPAFGTRDKRARFHRQISSGTLEGIGKRALCE